MRFYIIFVLLNLQQRFAESDSDGRDVAVASQLVAVPLRVHQNVQLVGHLKHTLLK